MTYTSSSGLFNTLDDIDVVIPNGVPAGFDLISLLSDNFRSQQQWFDLAQVTSNVLYQYVETQRIALSLARNPQNLSRVLKIATLRLMGIDWNSDYLTNDDYDRMLSTVSAYLQNHGGDDFVAYIGYALGVPLELVPLWTQDYATFLAYQQGLQPMAVIFDNPPGPWYPTTHVGIIYQEFAANASDADPSIITDVFYQMAPINLVLQWVGSQVSLSVGSIYFGMEFFEKEISTSVVELVHPTEMYIDQRMYERTFDTILTIPAYPWSAAYRGIGADVIDTGTDFAKVTAVPCTIWGPSASIFNPVDRNSALSPLSVVGGYTVPSITTPITVVEPWLQPWTNGIWDGVLVQESCTLLISSSGDPTYSTWGHVNIICAQTFTRYDSPDLGWTVSTIKGGYVTTSPLATGTDLVMLTLRPSAGTSSIYFTRGVDTVTFNVGTSTASSPNGSLRCGASAVGDGFYQIWAQITGGAISVYPAGSNAPSAVGGFDWLDLQVVQGGIYPLLTPSTEPAPGSTPLWIYFTGTDFSPDSSITDFGTVPNPPQFYNFPGGIAETFGIGTTPGVAQNSVPEVFIGTYCTVTTDFFNRPAGVMLFNMVSLHQEWVGNGGRQVLLELLASDGTGVRVSVSAANAIFEVLGSDTRPLLAPVPTNPIKWGIAWGPSGMTWYINGTVLTTPLLFASNLIVASLCDTIGVTSISFPDIVLPPIIQSTMIIQYVFVMGSTIVGNLPNDAYMRGMTT